jgi:putative chitinase
MELTQKQLQEIIPKNKYVNYWYIVLEQLLPQYEINTQNRIAAFLAQCAHESGEFIFIKENLNYRWQSLRKHFSKYFSTDALAQQYEKQPEKIANRIYANRMGNGSEESGDGWRFCGRGLIQVTGRENYSWFAASIEISVEEASEYMETFEGAAQSACWFWESNNLNKWADRGDILTLTKLINGGTIGLADRIKYFEHSLHVLEVK